MTRFLLPLLLLVAGEAAALACSCISPPSDPAAKRRLGRDMARDAVAMVEVELLAPFDRARSRGERLRVRRTLAGSAPAAFEVERRGIPSGAACDVTFGGGGRRLVLLYLPASGSGSAPPRFRISSSCTTYLLGDAAVRAAAVQAMTRRR